MTTRYDEATQTMWVESRTNADTLIPNTELSAWVSALKAGITSEGKPLSSVNFVFADAESAEYNQQPLAFSKIGTFVGTLASPKLLGDTPSFATQEDFGV